MNNYLFRFMVLGLLPLYLSGCSHRGSQRDIVFPSSFVVDTLYPVTSVKSQGRSSNCWAYSMASFFETEYLQCFPKDTLEISAEYIVRRNYELRFDDFCRTYGDTKKLSRGGLGHTFLRATRAYGLLPLSDYRADTLRADYTKLMKSIRKLARNALSSPSARIENRHRLTSLLDEKMGKLPMKEGNVDSRYAALLFLRRFPASGKQYIQLTSFMDSPYYRNRLLHLPDNTEQVPFYNIPLDQLINLMKAALENGYTFVWDGDISEPGFSVRKGIAVLPQTALVNDSTRLEGYLSGETTDNHMMHIVGMAHDENGESFFIAKNSYGKKGAYHGYIYLSETYVRLKTISILLDEKSLKLIQ